MKYLLALFVLVSLNAFSQVPQYIPYQAIARNSDGQVKANAAIAVQFRIYNTFSASAPVYQEEHAATTNDFGYFNLRIGNGTVQVGSFAAINWAGGDVSYEIMADLGNGFVQLGTRTGFMSVPYALYAANATPVPTLSINAPNSVISPSAGSYSINVPASTLSINGNSLNISNGNTVTLPTGMTYTAGAGVDINSGIISNTAPNQTVVVSPGINTQVSGAYPNYTIDATPALQLTGNQLSITGSNTVTLPAGVTYTPGTGMAIVSGSLINTAPDKTVTILPGTNTSVSGTYPTFTIDATPSLSINGNQLAISGSNTITLPAGVNYTAGPGIDINSGIISNTAPNQTVTLSGSGVSGSYPNYTITSPASTSLAAGTNVSLQQAGNTFTVNANPQLSLIGNSLSVSGGNTVALPPAPSYTAGTGISLNSEVITNTAPDQTVTIGAGANTAVSGTYPNFTVSATPSLAISGNQLSISGSNTINLPASTTYTNGSGIAVTGTVITNTAPDQTVTIGAGANTAVSGTYPNFTVSATPSLAISGNQLSISGSNTINLPASTTYTNGSGIAVTGTVISNTAPDQTVTIGSGANTVVSGTYPNFTVSATPSLAISGNQLSISGSNTINLPASTTYTNGSGIAVTGTVISNTAPDQTVTIGAGANTAVSGTYPNFTVSATPSLSISGNQLSISGSNTINLPASTTYINGSGIAVTGTVISNTAPDQTVTIGAGANTAVSGTYPNFTVSATPSLAINGNQLSISGSNTINLPASTTYTNGSGIAITGSVITNTAPDQAVSLTGPGVSGSYPNYSIAPVYQTLNQSGATVTLSNGGGSVQLPQYTPGSANVAITGTYPNQTVAVAIPSLSINSNSVSISGANTIVLPVVAQTSLTAGSNISISGAAPSYVVSAPSYSISNPPATNSLVISNGVSTSSVNVPSPVLAYNTGTLGVGSNTVLIPGTGIWNKPTAGTVALAASSDDVGIGTPSPTEKLSVLETGTAGGAGRFEISHASNGDDALFVKTAGAGPALHAQGGNGSNLAVEMEDGHLRTTQATAPSIANGSVLSLGSTALSANSTDVAGTATINTGLLTLVLGDYARVTFNKPYKTPPIVILTATNANGASINTYVTTSTTQFIINFNTTPNTLATYSFNYMVIEGK